MAVSSIGTAGSFGAAVTLAATASTFGLGAVPDISAGIIAATSASSLVEKVFDVIEDKIW